MSDIFYALRPLLYVSVALGLGPFAIDRASKSLKISKPRLAHSLSVSIGFATVSVYEVYKSLENMQFNNIVEYSIVLIYAYGMVMAFGILVQVIIRRKKIQDLVQNFHGVDTQFSKLDVCVPYDRVFRYSCAIIFSLSLLFPALLAHDYYNSTNFYTVSSWYTYFAPIVFSTFMEFQFISGGLLLKMHFRLLNERLTKLGTEENQNDLKKLAVIDGGYYGYFEPHLTRRSSERPREVLEVNLSRYRMRKVMPRNESPDYPLSSLAKVKMIRKIHSNLCEIKELLNSSYSLPLLSVIAQAFVIITTNLYAIFTTGTPPGSNSITIPIIWSLYRSVELVCIAVTCTKISKTANYTAVIVHKLLSQEWDSQIRNQLKLFSIQLLHRKISFNACGFFSLDMTLLHAIVAAATTYLVILIQFHNAYERH